MTTPAEHWRTVLRSALLAARKQRDAVRTAALRSALAAVDNAETPADTAGHQLLSGAIAGSVAGLGATEVARRVLTDDEIRSLLRAEVDERLSAAAEVDAGGFGERAEALREEAAVLTELLG
ncbi:glutamyl-tRNA amidotransferase [Mycolicibacterium baixiangningiae]|uniref:glutamyl-tRNA amidotransferase n=1 Tax=Mycolicibacterium baixiangningiae TaxID=2761578 RepID=UPI0018D1D5CD|nr:glutamyl-tRNA amidotransferase [Mycolicibacterium baixiangningiae]